MRMDATPELVIQWMRSVRDPWTACKRADWLIYVARRRGCPTRNIVQALARKMPAVDGPPQLSEVIEPVRELIAQCAAGEPPSSALDDRIRVHVRPRLIDWNVARQYHGASVPEGIPQRATPSEEPLRGSANAAFRLRKALASEANGDEAWPGLALVAEYIVFDRLGNGGNPLYNHVDNEALSTREAEVHQELCDALRTELSALGSV